MNWWREYADRMQCDAPLGKMTWFRLGGAARFLFRPRDADDLAVFVQKARAADEPVKVLGGGANVLVRDDGFDGVVVRLDHNEFRKVERSKGSLTVGAGVDLMVLSRDCSEQGLSGLECMAGIPGRVGGAVCMNAGGRWGEFGDVVQSVDVLDGEGRMERWSRDRAGFGYRSSEIGDRVVLSARLELTPDDPNRVRDKFNECFDYKQRSQPMADKSAGCIFKNPPGESAGALIDRAKLKGASCGAARVSDHHANFIVAESGAKASDVLRLIDLIRERVRETFNVELEVEIDIW